jgi:Na+-transporting NADH:ubiquinone oxidoreductase subunit NqrC
MIGHYILAGITLLFVFIMFLVISRTLNNMINLLIKIEYSLQKEFDLKQEALEVRRLMEEEALKEEEMQHTRKET